MIVENEDQVEQVTYSIVRFYKCNRPEEIITTGLTLEEAREHCDSPDTSGDDWFYGFRRE
jgi:hypothetical protein